MLVNAFILGCFLVSSFSFRRSFLFRACLACITTQVFETKPFFCTSAQGSLGFTSWLPLMRGASEKAILTVKDSQYLIQSACLVNSVWSCYHRVQVCLLIGSFIGERIIVNFTLDFRH